jgi:hypothetical protein
MPYNGSGMRLAGSFEVDERIQHLIFWLSKRDVLRIGENGRNHASYSKLGIALAVPVAEQLFLNCQ